jgi:hypothetical protein
MGTKAKDLSDTHSWDKYAATICNELNSNVN